MGKRVLNYLIDTNILIYYFNGLMDQSKKEVTETVFINSFNISIITEIEFLGWTKHTSQSFILAKEFIRNANVIDLNHPIRDQVIQLKRQYSIKLADAIIAATAIQNHFALMTRNDKDFLKIDELKIYNPYS